MAKIALTDPRVAAHLEEKLAGTRYGNRVLINPSSRFKGGRSHLALHKDAKGYFVRLGRRGSSKDYLGTCDIIPCPGSPIFQFTLETHDKRDAADEAAFCKKYGLDPIED